MAQQDNRNTGITFVCLGVVLLSVGFVVGVDGISAVLMYACAAVVIVLGALIVARSR